MRLILVFLFSLVIVTFGRLNCGDYNDARLCIIYDSQEMVEENWQGADCSVPVYWDAANDGARLGVGSECGPNSGGTIWYTNFETLNDTAWLQFRYKMNEKFRTEPLTYPGFTQISPKVIVTWYGPASCADQEFTMTNRYFDGFPQFYEDCGAVQLTHRIDGTSDFEHQPGGNTSCHWKVPHEHPPPSYPCWQYNKEPFIETYEETWATYTFRYDFLGKLHNDTPWVDVWAQNDGGKQYHILSYFLTTTYSIQSVYLSNYWTGKNISQVHPEDWYVWYQDLYVGTEKPKGFETGLDDDDADDEGGDDGDDEDGNDDDLIEPDSTLNIGLKFVFIILLTVQFL